MDELKIWAALYKEIAELFTDNITTVEWVDLWHNQVGFLETEHPFPTPACFLGFRILQATDLGKKAQELVVQMDVYYFYETFSDTFEGSYNQTDALEYLNTLSDIFNLMHGASGEYFYECKRVGFGAVDTGSAGNLYKQTFTMVVQDTAAMDAITSAVPGDVTVSEGEKPIVEKNKPFII